MVWVGDASPFTLSGQEAQFQGRRHLTLNPHTRPSPTGKCARRWDGIISSSADGSAHLPGL